MVLVDSSVWIAYLKNQDINQVDYLETALKSNSVLMCDLVMMEVLRGISNNLHYEKVKKLFLELEQVEVAYRESWLDSINWYRSIRKDGYTVRSQIDILLAMFCHKEGIALLHNDRDFDLIQQYYAFPVYKVKS
ncbi:PIN domain nuclease [bacterium]|nr:MAG: PIN domain nuclease [bacterium]